MKAPKFLIHVLSILVLLLLSVVLSIFSEEPFILSLINTLFLIGLLLFIIGSVMLIFLWGTFDVFSRGFRMLKKSKYTEEEQALMDYGEEEQQSTKKEKELKTKRNGNIALTLLSYGILIVVLSFALLPMV